MNLFTKIFKNTLQMTTLTLASLRSPHLHVEVEGREKKGGRFKAIVGSVR